MGKCDVCEHMCMHIHVCDQSTLMQCNVMQLHILFEGEIIGMLNNDGIRCSITIVHSGISCGNHQPKISLIVKYQTFRQLAAAYISGSGLRSVHMSADDVR